MAESMREGQKDKQRRRKGRGKWQLWEKRD